jgi:sec-independent protein translocase protein TatB
MNFLGVGPFELILILVLGLVVLGPERLRSMGRSTGKLVAQLLAWQQQSPEAQMVQQIRDDFQREIVDLRDELVRARQQLDISAEVQRLREETGSIMPENIASLEARARASMPDTADAEPAAAASERTTDATAPEHPPAASEPAHTAEAPAASEPAHTSEPPPETVPTNGTVDKAPSTPDASDTPDTPAHPPETVDKAPSTPDAPDTPDTPAHPPEAPAAPPADDLAPVAGVALPEHIASPDAAQEHLAHQLQALVADMHALQEQLRRRGLLDAAWEPPSTHGTPPVEHEHETLSSR